MAKPKRTARMLTRLDVEILRFIWKWKLANLMTLKYALAPQRSFWKFYRIMRRLNQEGYIQEKINPEIQATLWTLTKKGFQVLDDGSMSLKQKRYQPQSVLHDYWMMAFQLGDFVFGTPENVDLVSEQELSARELADLPEWLPQSLEHIPDGFTFIKNPEASKLVAFEIEISIKEKYRYDEMIHYLDMKNEIKSVVWLCGTEKMVEVITKRIVAITRLRPMLHNFVLLSHFKKRGWDAKFIWGEMEGRTIAEVMGQPSKQHAVNIPVTAGAPSTIKVLLSNVKSPRSLKGLADLVDPLSIPTP